MPIAASWRCLKLFYRYGKPNYFGFVFWNSFVVGALTMLLVGLADHGIRKI